MTATRPPQRDYRFGILTPGAVAFACLVLLSACVSQTVRTVDTRPPTQLAEPPAEDLLLDVGIAVFDANVPDDYDEQIKQLIQPEIRRAEANYMAYVQKNLLQSTGNWGAVRVIPRETHAVDLVVEAKILHSSGESMRIVVNATDARGVEWLDKKYEALASKYAYDDSVPSEIDPFQAIYKEIANDLLAARQKLTDAEIRDIRRLAEVKFAQSFAPDAFADHVEQREDGSYALRRLPAENDPTLARVRKIREREYLFIDTLDEHYDNFHRMMYTSYQDWRQATYAEEVSLKKLRAQSRARTIAGTAGIVGGIAAAQRSDSALGRVGGFVGIAASAGILKSAIAKRAEAKIHAEVLLELGTSAEAEISPHTIELENESVRLQGSVDKQYEELRGILRQIYIEEVGLPLASEESTLAQSNLDSGNLDSGSVDNDIEQEKPVTSDAAAQ